MSALTDMVDITKSTKANIKKALEDLTGSPISTEVFRKYLDILAPYSIRGTMNQPEPGRPCTEAITEFVIPDTSNITNFYNFFAGGVGKLTTIDLSNVNTSNATSMPYMFYNWMTLEYVDLSGFDIKKVRTMHSFFYNDRNLTHFDAPKGEAASLEDLSDFAGQCSSLERFDLSTFKMPNSTLHNLSYLIYSCPKLTYADISNLKLNKNKDVNIDYLIWNCPSLVTIKWPSKMYSNNNTVNIEYIKCQKLSKESILQLFKALQPPPAGKSKTLCLDKVHQSKFTSAETNILTNKGWGLTWK